MKIESTVAIISGGAQGIGKAICEALLEKGGKVCILDVNNQKGTQQARAFEEKYGRGRVLFIHCDVTSKIRMEAAFQQTKEVFGRLDIVCNNAGTAGLSDELTDGVWERLIEVNLKGVILGTILGLKYMGTTAGKGHGGTIINVASMAGLLPSFNQPVYTATKHGVVGFSRSLELMRDQEGVRVNCICPTYTDTAMLRTLLTLADQASTVSALEQVRLIKMVGIISPKLVASGVVQLIEDESKNAAVMRVTAQKGIDYKRYRDIKPRL